MLSTLPNRLPPVREALKISSGPVSEGGAPTWHLQDTSRNLFFRIGWQEFVLMSHWHLGDAAQIVSTVNRETTLTVQENDVAALYQFLVRHQLLQRLDQQQPTASSRKFSPAQLFQKFFFFKMPLVQPDRFLTATLPFVRFFFSKVLLYALSLSGVLGLYLVSRQWDSFQNTFLHFFSASGFLLMLFALVFSKIAHELGHAYAAKRYGLHVPSMGVAWMVFWPVLYTDLTESWKLQRRGPRLWIAAAGILVEMGIAALALLFWNLLPEGPLRSAMFLLAFIGWTTTLIINLNPLMRFDGYYLFSDFLEMPNLQARASALGRWRLRKLLFGWESGCPEIALSDRKRNGLILYAYVMWGYRLLLFSAIILAIYHFFFKLLGLLFFAIGCYALIIRPIASEIALWWRHRAAIRSNVWRVVVTISLLLLSLLFLMIPTRYRIHAPALLHSGEQVPIYAPFSGRVERVRIENGMLIQKSDPLFVVESPELIYREKQLTLRIKELRSKIRRQSTQEPFLERHTVDQRALEEVLTEQEALRARLARRILTAPMAGKVVNRSRELHVGRWVDARTRLALLVNEESLVIDAYLEERDINEVSVGSLAKFYPEYDLSAVMKCRVQMVDPIGVTALDQPYLASLYGGAVAVWRDDSGALIPDTAHYRVRLIPLSEDSDSDSDYEKMPHASVVRGNVLFEGASRTLLNRFWQRLKSVLIRESGF